MHVASFYSESVKEVELKGSNVDAYKSHKLNIDVCKYLQVQSAINRNMTLSTRS